MAPMQTRGALLALVAITIACGPPPSPAAPPRSDQIGDRAADLELGRIGGLIEAGPARLPGGVSLTGVRGHASHLHDGNPVPVGHAAWQVTSPPGVPSLVVHVDRAWKLYRTCLSKHWYSADPLTLDPPPPPLTVAPGTTAALELTFTPVRIYSALRFDL